MTRFNYLADAAPDAVERLRGARLPAELRTPLAGLFTACVVVLSWAFLERYWMNLALREQAAARVRLDQSRNALAATKLVRSNIDELLALDARLRSIRLSGSAVAGRLVDIGNSVPAHAWLTAITPDGNELTIEGKARGLNVVSEAVERLASAPSPGLPTLLHAASDGHDKAALITFAVSVGGSVK